MEPQLTQAWSRRPGVPVPPVFKHGISDGDVKGVTERGAIYINKTLGWCSGAVLVGHACLLIGVSMTQSDGRTLTFCGCLQPS